MPAGSGGRGWVGGWVRGCAGAGGAGCRGTASARHAVGWRAARASRPACDAQQPPLWPPCCHPRSNHPVHAGPAGRPLALLPIPPNPLPSRPALPPCPPCRPLPPSPICASGSWKGLLPARSASLVQYLTLVGGAGQWADEPDGVAPGATSWRTVHPSPARHRHARASPPWPAGHTLPAFTRQSRSGVHRLHACFDSQFLPACLPALSAAPTTSRLCQPPLPCAYTSASQLKRADSHLGKHSLLRLVLTANALLVSRAVCSSMGGEGLASRTDASLPGTGLVRMHVVACTTAQPCLPADVKQRL